MPAAEYIDPHSTVFQRTAEIEIEGVTFRIEIELTEGGSLEMSALENPDGLVTEKTFTKLSGITDQDERLIARNVYCNSDEMFIHLSVSSIEIFGDEDWFVEGEEVTLNADVLGFQYVKHSNHFKVQDEIDLFEESETPAGGGNFADWSIKLSPFVDYQQRVEFIQNYYNLVRTVHIQIDLEGIYGDQRRVTGFANDRWEEMSYILSFLQGTLPVAPKIKIQGENDSGPIYVRIENVQSNIGSGCKMSEILFYHHSEISIFLDRAYNTYLNKRDSLKLREVFGLYIDSLNTRRPVQPRLVNLCIGIEIIANHFNADQGNTEEQIQTLLDDLDVKYKDLIVPEGSFPTKYLPSLYKKQQEHILEYNAAPKSIYRHILEDALPAPHEKNLGYFWYRSRNHVIHGGSTLSFRELTTDYNSLVVLFRRILRRLLVGENTTRLHGLKELERKEFLEFGE